VPWALDGGREGSPNYVEVMRAVGRLEEYAVVTALEVNEGDVIRLHTANGAGYGDPRRRPRDVVLDDMRNGYVSEETAETVYGVDV
jgi:N-methylhydantoinase B